MVKTETPPDTPIWKDCLTLEESISMQLRSGDPGNREMRSKVPAMALKELKRKHGNISAWVRGRLKAEVGPEHWPENFELAVQESDQPELKFPGHIETLNELRARTVGRYRPTNFPGYSALLNAR